MQFELPLADEVHVISDLHLGGSGDFQMFQAGGLLSGYTRALIDTSQRRRWLVINGDFVDFLAESPSLTFDPVGAAKKLERLAADATFEPVFAALRDYVSTPDNRLAFVVGNHDVELAMPWVQQALIKTLTDGDSAKIGRIVFALDGKGFALRMAGPRGPQVLCLHGNEVDDWNVVDHEAVRKKARDMLRGQTIDADWRPNAGSRMVVEVMNDIKAEFPLVDLLKPEQEAVVPILLALKPAATAKLGPILALQAQRFVARARMAAGFLGDGDDTAETALDQGHMRDPIERSTHARTLTRQRKEQSQQLARMLLNRADVRLAAGESASDQLAGDDQGAYLGLTGAALSLLRLDPVEALRQKLDVLEQDRSFDVSARDATYEALDRIVSTDIDFLVAGHTHLPRAIQRRYGQCYYFNSGTWARILRLDDAVRRSPGLFAAWFQAVKAHKPESEHPPGLVPEPPTAVVIQTTADGVVGELRRFKAGEEAHGTGVPNTRFRRS